MALGVLRAPFGPLCVVTSELGVVGIDFGTSSRVLPSESSDGPAAASHLERALTELSEYLAGVRRSFSVPLERAGRQGFRGEVLDALEGVPFGHTVTYAELAGLAGRPRAHRAVGTTMGLNPIAVIVPCHRVLRAGGALGQYGGGVAAKRWLLELEGWTSPAVISPAAPTPGALAPDAPTPDAPTPGAPTLR